MLPTNNCVGGFAPYQFEFDTFAGCANFAGCESAWLQMSWGKSALPPVCRFSRRAACVEDEVTDNPHPELPESRVHVDQFHERHAKNFC